MPIYVGDFYDRINEMQKAQEFGSQPLLSCMESIDATLWLLAGNRIPQALVMLHNSVEIVFKSELERIHPLLINEIRKLDYEAIKGLLKNSLQSNDRGQKMDIVDFEIERNFNTDKTITFDEAKKRVAEFHPVVKPWNSKLTETKNSRNNITHYGSKREDRGTYIGQITTILFPFIETFLREIGIDFEKLVTSSVYREIQVAKKVCERLEKEHNPIGSYTLKTIALKMLYQNVDFPKASDITGKDDYDDNWIVGDWMKKQLEKEWDESFIKKDCKICDSIDLFVKVEPNFNNSLHVLAAKCPHCGLDISESEEYLAEYHVGELNQEDVEFFLRDIGEWKEV
jgi:hypothetical protein